MVGDETAGSIDEAVMRELRASYPEETVSTVAEIAAKATAFQEAIVEGPNTWRGILAEPYKKRFASDSLDAIAREVDSIRRLLDLREIRDKNVVMGLFYAQSHFEKGLGEGKQSPTEMMRNWDLYKAHCTTEPTPEDREMMSKYKYEIQSIPSTQIHKTHPKDSIEPSLSPDFSRNALLLYALEDKELVDALAENGKLQADKFSAERVAEIQRTISQKLDILDSEDAARIAGAGKAKDFAEVVECSQIRLYKPNTKESWTAYFRDNDGNSTKRSGSEYDTWDEKVVLARVSSGGWSNGYLLGDIENTEDKRQYRFLKVLNENLAKEKTQTTREQLDPWAGVTPNYHVLFELCGEDEYERTGLPKDDTAKNEWAKDVADRVLEMAGALRVLEELARREQEMNEALVNTSNDDDYYLHKPIPNFCGSTVVGVGKETRPAMIYEFIEGETIQDRMEEASLTERIDMLRKTAYALGYIHEKGLTHNDVKPDNVMIAANGRPYLLDMALSNLGGERLIQGSLRRSDPEAIRQGHTSPRNDQFSFGLMAHEVLTGKRLMDYTESTYPEFQDAHGKGEKVIDQVQLPEDPAYHGLTTMLRRCLREDGAQPYDNMRQVEEELQTIQESVGDR